MFFHDFDAHREPLQLSAPERDCRWSLDDLPDPPSFWRVVAATTAQHLGAPDAAARERVGRAIGNSAVFYSAGLSVVTSAYRRGLANLERRCPNGHGVSKIEWVEDSLDEPPAPVYDDLPKDEANGWKFIAIGPDNKLVVALPVFAIVEMLPLVPELFVVAF